MIDFLFLYINDGEESQRNASKGSLWSIGQFSSRKTRRAAKQTDFENRRSKTSRPLTSHRVKIEEFVMVLNGFRWLWVRLWISWPFRDTLHGYLFNFRPKFNKIWKKAFWKLGHSVITGRKILNKFNFTLTPFPFFKIITRFWGKDIYAWIFVRKWC